MKKQNVTVTIQPSDIVVTYAKLFIKEQVQRLTVTVNSKKSII